MRVNTITKKVCCLVLLLPMVTNVYSQQDPQYTQYMFNQLAYNPAYAGSRDVLSVYSLLRDQWAGIPGAPKTVVLCAQAPLKSNNVGIGFEAFDETIGPTNVSGLMGSYAYRIPVKNGSLAMGLRYGFYDYQYNWQMVDYKDPLDPVSMNAQNQQLIQTADAGLYYHTQTLYWGVSLTHLIPQKLVSGNTSLDSVTIKPHLYVTMGKAFQASENLIINPSFLFQAVQGSTSTNINLNFLLDQKIWLGISYRSQYGVSFLMQYCFSEKLKFGYSYDLGLNKIGLHSGGTNEILLQYDINIQKTKTLSPRFL